MAIPAPALDQVSAPAKQNHAPLPATTVPTEVAITDVLCRVRQDRQRAPEAYLDETVTPHGGE